MTINEIETYIQKIAKNREDFNELVAAIKNNLDLSFEGRSSQLSAAWKSATVKHNELKKALISEIETTSQEKRERAFGAKKADEVAYNLALSEAGKADDKQLVKLLNRALLTGNRLLNTAVAVAAYERGDPRVLQSTAETDPDIADFMAFEQSLGSLRNASEKFRWTMAISGPSAPTEADRETLNKFG